MWYYPIDIIYIYAYLPLNKFIQKLWRQSWVYRRNSCRYHWKHIKIIHCGIFWKYRDNIPQKFKIKSDRIYRKYFDEKLKYSTVDYFDNILCNILIQKTVDCQFIFKIFTLYSQVVYFDGQPQSAMEVHQNKFKIVYNIL